MIFFLRSEGFLKPKLYLEIQMENNTILRAGCISSGSDFRRIIDAIFFDANSGWETLTLFGPAPRWKRNLLSCQIIDRLYLNDGKGKFSLKLGGIRNGYREQLSAANPSISMEMEQWI